MKKLHPKNEGFRVVKNFPFTTLWELSFSMETRVIIRSGSSPYLGPSILGPSPNVAFPPTPTMLQMKLDFDQSTGLRDSYV